MKKPTKTQSAVLEAMRDGAKLYRAEWVNDSNWSLTRPQGFSSRVNRSTAEALRAAEWIGPAGTPQQVNISTRRLDFALTDLGRAVIER